MAKKKKSVAKKKKAKAPKKKAKKTRKVRAARAAKVVKQKPEPVPQDIPVVIAQEPAFKEEKAPVVQQPTGPTNLEQVEKEINQAAEKGKEQKKGFWARLFGK